MIYAQASPVVPNQPFTSPRRCRPVFNTPRAAASTAFDGSVRTFPQPVTHLEASYPLPTDQRPRIETSFAQSLSPLASTDYWDGNFPNVDLTRPEYPLSVSPDGVQYMPAMSGLSPVFVYPRAEMAYMSSPFGRGQGAPPLNVMVNSLGYYAPRTMCEACPPVVADNFYYHNTSGNTTLSSSWNTPSGSAFVPSVSPLERPKSAVESRRTAGRSAVLPQPHPPHASQRMSKKSLHPPHASSGVVKKTPHLKSVQKTQSPVDEPKRENDSANSNNQLKKPKPPVGLLPTSLGTEHEMDVFAVMDRSSFSAKLGGVEIRMEDLATLKPSQRLNNPIVNFYGELLVDRRKTTRRTDERDIYFFNTSFWPALVSNGSKGNYKKWMEVDIFQQELLMIPILHNRFHWSAATIDFGAKSIELYGTMLTPSATIFKLLRSFLDNVRLAKPAKKPVPFDFSNWVDRVPTGIPLSPNSEDTGVFICQYFEHLSRGKKTFNFNQSDVPYLRRRMILEISTMEMWTEKERLSQSVQNEKPLVAAPKVTPTETPPAAAPTK